MGGPWREKKKAPMKMSRFVLKIWKYRVRFHKMKFFTRKGKGRSEGKPADFVGKAGKE